MPSCLWCRKDISDDSLVCSYEHKMSVAKRHRKLPPSIRGARTQRIAEEVRAGTYQPPSNMDIAQAMLDGGFVRKLPRDFVEKMAEVSSRRYARSPDWEVIAMGEMADPEWGTVEWTFDPEWLKGRPTKE